MTDWIFLSKNGEDDFINMFAKGCKTPITSTEEFKYDDSDSPIVLRGILKHKIMKRCWDDRRDFYYMDTGYFGNEMSPLNPNGWKFWHRIVKNDLQHNEIIQRPDDRWKLFGKKFVPWKKNGKKILIACPDEKPCKFYGVDQKDWIRDTVDKIKHYSGRPIEIRERSPLRLDRLKNKPLSEALQDDVFALVTFNSNAATESILQGIPVFTLAPTNAASPVGLQDLSLIDEPYYPDRDKLYAWGCHLSYGQFHVSELRSGKAKEMLESN